MSRLAKFMRKAREAKGLTRHYMAVNMGFSDQFYGHVERGLAPLPPTYFKTFLKLTGACPEQLSVALIQDYAKQISQHMPRRKRGQKDD